MTYSFRVRLNRSPTDTIQTEANEIVLTVEEEPVRRLRLHNPESGATILNSTQLVLTCDGYDTEAEALAAGERYQDALAIALARHRVGADFGLRVPKGFFTEAGLAMLQQQLGQPVLNSVHGLMASWPSPPSQDRGSLSPAPGLYEASTKECSSRPFLPRSQQDPN